MPHPLEISKDDVTRVEVVKAFSNVLQLKGYERGAQPGGKRPTRPGRYTSELCPMYTIRSPPGIQSKMSLKGATMIPWKGTMFG